MLWQAQLDGLLAFEQEWVHGAVRGLGRSETARHVPRQDRDLNTLLFLCRW